MTEQIGDIYIRKGKRYEGRCESQYDYPLSCVNIFGIDTMAWASYCWRGHIAEYEICNNELILKELSVFGIKPFPKIDNRRPKGSIFNLFRRKRVVVYKRLNIKIPYTGEIYLERELKSKSELYLNSDYLEDEIRMVFQNGDLVE